MELETTKTLVFVLGIILGSLTILVALVISFFNKKISTSVIGALVIGTVLLGLSVWTSIRIELPGGIVVDLEKKLKEMEKIVVSIKTERDALLNQVQRMETTVNQIDTTAVKPGQIQNLRNSLTDIKSRNSSIEKYLLNLDSINKTTKTELEKLKKSTKSKPGRQQ